MENYINARLRLFALLAVVSMWAGYAIGYHLGVRDERRGWWSSVQLDRQGNLVFLGPQAKAGFDAFLTDWNPIPDKADNR